MSARKSGEDRRADIQQATLALAFELGPDRVTTSRIAARLGLTQPAIYKHFPGKEELWKAITENLAAQIHAYIDAAEEQASGPVDQMRRLVIGHLKLVQATPGLPVVMVARPEKGAQFLKAGVRASMTRLSGAITAAIVEAQKAGHFRSDIAAQDISALIMGVVQSLVLRFLVTQDPSVLLKDADRLLDLQLSAFAQPGEQI